jgi:hypothetical protein
MSNERSGGKGARSVVQRPADGQQKAEGEQDGEGWKSPTNLGVKVLTGSAVGIRDDATHARRLGRLPS